MKSALEIIAVFVGVILLIIVIANLSVISAGLALFGASLLQFLQIAMYGFLVMAGGGAIIFAYAFIDKRKELRLRQQDGSYALREYTVNGVKVLVDVNKMIGPAAAIHETLGFREFEPAAGWQLATSHAKTVERTRMMQAIVPGDFAVMGMLGYKPPAIPAAVVNHKTTKEELQAAMMPPPDIEVPRLPAPVIAPQQLIDRNQPTRLALGQDVETGAPAYWTLPFHPHVRVHGSTQSGKTALGRFLVMQAIQHGYEVVIYDRRRGKDWGIFRNHAQVIDVRSTSTLVRHLEGEVQRYQERDALLGQHNASTLEALAQKTGQAYRRRLIVIEELGIQHINARSDGKAAYQALTSSLARLTSEAGATGIHGIYLDQMPKEWDQRIRYNCAAVVFHLPDHGGQVAGYQAAHELPRHHCWFDDQIIKTGHMEEDDIVDALSGVHSGTDPVEPYFLADEGTEDTADTITQRQYRIIKHFEDNPDDGIRSAARTLDISKSHVWKVRQMMLGNEIDVDAEVE